MIIGSFIYLGFFHAQHNDFFYKDISLTGGTSVTINDGNINSEDLKNTISGKLDDVNIRQVSDLATQKQIAVIVETRSEQQQTKMF